MASHKLPLRYHATKNRFSPISIKIISIIYFKTSDFVHSSVLSMTVDTTFLYITG